MTDPFKNYDRWKLMSPEDEMDERERRRQIAQAREDMADEMRDRERDEPREYMWENYPKYE